MPLSSPSAAALSEPYGGIAGIVGRCARDAGLREKAGEETAGDVGVVPIPTLAGQIKPVGALCTGARWALLTQSGLVSIRVDPITVWGL